MVILIRAVDLWIVPCQSCGRAVDEVGKKSGQLLVLVIQEFLPTGYPQVIVDNYPET
jgi:hypothetical protein